MENESSSQWGPETGDTSSHLELKAEIQLAEELLAWKLEQGEVESV